jgi:hypothetical protein
VLFRYAAVIANLTDGDNLLAVLNNVTVHANSYLGVKPYVLDQLIIISNQMSEAFLSQFRDRKIRQSLQASKQWPNKYPAGMTTLDANALCVFQGWKVQKHADLLRSLFP